MENFLDEEPSVPAAHQEEVDDNENDEFILEESKTH